MNDGWTVTKYTSDELELTKEGDTWFATIFEDESMEWYTSDDDGTQPREKDDDEDEDEDEEGDPNWEPDSADHWADAISILAYNMGEYS